MYNTEKEVKHFEEIRQAKKLIDRFILFNQRRKMSTFDAPGGKYWLEKRVAEGVESSHSVDFQIGAEITSDLESIIFNTLMFSYLGFGMFTVWSQLYSKVNAVSGHNSIW